MSILFLLKEHGSMTFKEISDIIGSGIDPISLQNKLTSLVEEGFIVWSENDYGEKLYYRKER